MRCSIHFLNFFYCENREEKLHSNISPKYFKVERLSNLKKKRKLSELVLNSSWIQSRGNLAYENSSLKSEVCFHKSALSDFKSWISGYYLLANDLLELFKCDCLLDFKEQNLKRSRQISFCGNEESRWKMILKPFQKPCPRCTLLAKRGVLKISINQWTVSILTQNSLKYSRHTKFFNLVCETLT